MARHALQISFIVAFSSAAVVLLGCGKDNNFDQGVSDDTAETQLPGDGDTDTGPIGPGPGPTGDDTDTDVDETTRPDTDTEVDETTEPDPDNCNHPWEPVDVVGASKTFSVSADGATGEENISIIGASTTPITYRESWKYIAQLGPLSDGREYSGSVYVGCESDGMYMLEWSQIYTDSSGSYTITGVDSPGRKYLPDPATLGFVGSWNYNYTMDISADYNGKPYSLPMSVSGSYTEFGFETIEVSGVSYEAYKLNNTYTIVFGGVSGYGAFTRNGNIDFYYVENLGLVYEEQTYEFDIEPGVLHNVVKSLTSTSGL